MRNRIRILPLTLMRIRIWPSFQVKVKNKKVLKWAHISYILACHMQIDADPDQVYHYDSYPDPTFQFYADPNLDPEHCLE
jgi:hypothetical protein